MKKFLKNIFQRKSTKLLLGITAVIVVIAVCQHMTGWEQVFAQDNTPSPADVSSGSSGPFGALEQGLGAIISGLSTLFIKLLAGIIWFVLYWMGDLMDNTFILEGDIGEKLRSVWVIVRNFVNIFFALVLVVAALMSVIGYGDEGGNYAMKKFIPKMAIALIAVNFTFLACRLVLDVNNVLTTAIFSIPQSVTNLGEIAPTGTNGVKIFRKFKCLDSNANYDKQVQDMVNLDQRYPGVINSLGGVCFAQVPTEDLNTVAIDTGGQQIVNLDSSQFSKKDFVWTMATQFQGLHQLNKVSQLTDRNFTNLTVNAVFSIVFAVIYGTAYVAMFIILLARMVVLWITIMLSPLIAVSIVIPDLLPEELNIQKKFLDHAFVPAKMAVPLSFGYILISQMSLSIDTNLIQDKTIDLSSGEFARDISITSLMYGAASVAVIWMGVFAASKDVVGSELVGKIGDYVKGAGATVAKWPTYLPILPVSGGGVSFQTIMTGVDTLKNTITEDRRRRDEERVKNYLGKLDIMNDEIRGLINDLERKTETRSMDVATASNIKRLQDTPHAFDRVAKAWSETEWRDSQSKATVAQSFGFEASENGFREFQQMVAAKRFEELRERVKTTSTVTPSGGSPTYMDIASGALDLPDNQRSLQLDRATFNGIDASVRSSLNLAEPDAATNMTTFTLGDVDFGSFMNSFKEKMAPEARKSFVMNGFLESLVSRNPDVQVEMARDTNLMSKIRSLRTNGTSHEEIQLNNKIRSLIKVIKFGNNAVEEQELTTVSGITDQGKPYTRT